MLTTANLKLKKPEGTDVVNIEDLNYNADVLDSEINKRALKTDIPKVPVTSVAGKTGAVTLAKSDVGLNNVNNWSASSDINNASDTTYATAGAVKKAYDRVSNLMGKPNGVAGLNSSGKIDPVYIDSTINFTKLPSIGNKGGSYSNIKINNYIEILFNTYAPSPKIYFNGVLLFSGRSGTDRYMGRIVIDKNGNCYIGYGYLDYSDYPSGYEIINLLMGLFAPDEKKTVTVSDLNTISVTRDTATHDSIEVEVVSW